MSETLRLWTTGDIAKELGVRTGLVYNWANRGVYWLPKPYATSQPPRCQSLWTDDQVKKIISLYYRGRPSDD